MGTAWGRMWKRQEKRKKQALIKQREEAYLASRTPEQIEKDQKRSEINKANGRRGLISQGKLAQESAKEREQAKARAAYEKDQAMKDLDAILDAAFNYNDSPRPWDEGFHIEPPKVDDDSKDE